MINSSSIKSLANYKKMINYKSISSAEIVFNYNMLNSKSTSSEEIANYNIMIDSKSINYKENANVLCYDCLDEVVEFLD